MRRALALSALALALAAPVRADDSGPTLRHDPFEQRKPPPPAAPSEAPSNDAGALPLLRATLVAGDASLVDLGGVILRIGEQSQGYRLVEVREWDADFERDGERATLSLLPPAEPEP